MSKLRVLDCFSGIGGFALGLEDTGHFETVAFIELDPFCRAVLAKHWPTIPCHDDIRTFDPAEFVRRHGRPDVVCGGFPCQQVSCVGKGEGLGTEQSPTDRSGLWFEMLRIVRAVRPSWVLAENVGGLRVRGGDEVIAGLEREGYAVWPLVVGAWAVGAPHKRDRVWIVANLARDSGKQRTERLRVGECGKQLADADCARRNGARVSVFKRRSQQAGGNIAGTSQGLANGDGAGLEIDEGERRDAREECAAALGSRWPARPGEPQHEWERPRLADAAYWSS